MPYRLRAIRPILQWLQYPALQALHQSVQVWLLSFVGRLWGIDLPMQIA